MYTSIKNPPTAERAVIVLPEIFGMNKFIISTTDRFAQELGVKAFALDHFYPVTGQSQVFPYDDHDKPIATMQQLGGQQFLDFFTGALDEIAQANPDVKENVVCGFCFGGKLAFLAGTDKRINRIVSFYGSSSVQPGFIGEDSVIQALTKARQADPHLKVIGMFGKDDPSIPEAARHQIETELKAAGIDYQSKVYDTGHAFMNFERSNLYNEAASRQAWADVLDFLKN
jgi:carboxymethylenebutenolidase